MASPGTSDVNDEITTSTSGLATTFRIVLIGFYDAAAAFGSGGGSIPGILGIESKIASFWVLVKRCQ